jgi:hypothetical protein
MINENEIINKLKLEIEELKNKNNQLDEKIKSFKQIQKNIDWYTVKEEDIQVFIPPIKYGKVMKINTYNSFTIATQISFLNEDIKKTSLYKFVIYLDGINLIKSNQKFTKDNNEDKIIEILKKMMHNRMVELRCINLNKNGHLHANVYVDDTNVNEYLIKNKYIIKGKTRRMTEPNYSCYKKIFQEINSSLESNEINSKKNSFLPLINVYNIEEDNLNSSSSSIL